MHCRGFGSLSSVLLCTLGLHLRVQEVPPLDCPTPVSTVGPDWEERASLVLGSSSELGYTCVSILVP